ncbi:MAG: hypothetical protein AAFV33_15045 [Chloroflexota bacterium]
MKRFLVFRHALEDFHGTAVRVEAHDKHAAAEIYEYEVILSGDEFHEYVQTHIEEYFWTDDDRRISWENELRHGEGNVITPRASELEQRIRAFFSDAPNYADLAVRYWIRGEADIRFPPDMLAHFFKSNYTALTVVDLNDIPLISNGSDKTS